MLYTCLYVLLHYMLKHVSLAAQRSGPRRFERTNYYCTNGSRYFWSHGCSDFTILRFIMLFISGVGNDFSTYI